MILSRSCVGSWGEKWWHFTNYKGGGIQPQWIHTVGYSASNRRQTGDMAVSNKCGFNDYLTIISWRIMSKIFFGVANFQTNHHEGGGYAGLDKPTMSTYV